MTMINFSTNLTSKSMFRLWRGFPRALPSYLVRRLLLTTALFVSLSIETVWNLQTHSDSFKPSDRYDDQGQQANSIIFSSDDIPALLLCPSETERIDKNKDSR